MKDLTRRQAEIMDWVCLGKTNAEISQILDISQGTVKSHLNACRLKLEASRKTLMVAKYLLPTRYRRV